MPKYIRVTRSDEEGSYTLAYDEILNLSYEFELLEWMGIGTTVTLTVIEMTEEEYKNLPEFMGW